MEKIEIKIHDLEKDIEEIELEVIRLLNYGTVPVNNWITAADLLNKRAVFYYTLKELKEVYN